MCKVQRKKFKTDFQIIIHLRNYHTDEHKRVTLSNPNQRYHKTERAIEFGFVEKKDDGTYRCLIT